jgi:glycosyltransferase involved in cell wall biosynthesis
MHALQLNFFLDWRRSPRDILRHWQGLSDVAVAAAAGGANISVVQACATQATFTDRGIVFHFIPPASPGTPLTRTRAFTRLLAQLAPDVAHVHGLGFAREVLDLRTLSPELPILLQDHADRVPRFWRRGAMRRSLDKCTGVSFCARAQAEPFRGAGLLGPHVEVFEIPESTSSFQPGDQAAARAACGIHGDPAVLWVGHLNGNKDPLTILEAVSIARRRLPGLQLWFCFGSAPLQQAVEARIARDVELRGCVHLLGPVPHEQVETLMRAADVFVLGSHREGSSFSLIEALATGLTPVVTAIPSLRVLTGNGEVGTLFPCGDAHACADALQRAAYSLQPGARERVRAFFDAHLSHSAIGRRFAEAYDRIRGGARVTSTAA